MVKSVTKVVYKPDTQSTDEFIVIVNPAEYRKWKNGGERCQFLTESVPLAEVVDSFEVFHSGQGAQGLLGRPSKQQLDNTFGTSKDVEVISIVLEKGKEQPGESFTGTSGTYTLNVTRGSADLNNKGKGWTGM
ncbi:DUF1960-domain-containing protein [Melanogaster broomeanus]|nr:DUF1960-domain-containing protein [Melanogaster broomeanus]